MCPSFGGNNSEMEVVGRKIAKFVSQDGIIVWSTQAWLTVFSSFLLQKVCVRHPNLANILGSISHVCINKLFASTPLNVDFAH